MQTTNKTALKAYVSHFSLPQEVLHTLNPRKRPKFVPFRKKKWADSTSAYLSAGNSFIMWMRGDSPLGVCVSELTALMYSAPHNGHSEEHISSQPLKQWPSAFNRLPRFPYSSFGSQRLIGAAQTLKPAIFLLYDSLFMRSNTHPHKLRFSHSRPWNSSHPTHPRFVVAWFQMIALQEKKQAL